MEKIRRIKIEMLKETRYKNKNKHIHLLNEIIGLDDEINIIKNSLEINEESTQVSDMKQAVFVSFA